MKNLYLFLSTALLSLSSFMHAQTLSGSGNYTVPCGVTSITVQVWGGGGAGGGSSSTAGGGGGGASGCYTTTVIGVTPGQIIAYSVGAGGNGTSGGNTTFGGITAAGGGAGAAGPSGAGGTVTGGCSANAGAAGGVLTGGAGGSAPSGGAGGAQVTGTTNGNNGTAPGGGGGGGGIKGGGNRTGGNGGAGSIIVTPGAAVLPNTANAGPSQNLAACATSTTLAANTATPGTSTGTWSCVAGCAGVTFGNVNSPTSTVSGLTPGTSAVLRWTISAPGCTSTTSDVTINTFTGPLCPVYCSTVTHSSAAGSISNVSFGGLINSSSAFGTGYNNNPTCATVIAGSSYSFTGTISSPVGTANSMYVYIDANGDGDFADAGESIPIETNLSSSNLSATGTITIPGSAYCGATVRMRVVYKYNATSSTAEALCGDVGTYGDTKDFCLTITCPPPTCTDGFKNGTETGVDCGGPCPACVELCTDGIQNSDETGVDCGGAFCLPCTTNNGTPDGNSAPCCDGVVDGTVYGTTCDQIGTSAYNLLGPEIRVTSGIVPPACVPTGSPLNGCAAYTNTGTWFQLDLAPGVTYLQLSVDLPDIISFGTGNSQTNYAFFQGTGCGALTPIACKPAISFITGQYGFFEASVTGLDPNQDVWVYAYNDNGKDFDYILQATGAVPATNQSCPGTTAIGEACNLGASGATFTTPAAGGYSCTGGNWGSNENTTFYSFTADSTAAELIIDAIVCNDGETGRAQFGVWTSCAAIGQYPATHGATSGFLGCAVGTATLSLASLTLGQTYYIAADGYAGDNCTWGFTGDGIVLPIELAEFNAYHNGRAVELDWATSSESNNDYFTIQRSKDGSSFESIGTVDGAGTTVTRQDYSFVDNDPYMGISYYRIKQTDFDGRFKYTDIRAVSAEEYDFEIIPNPTNNDITLSFHSLRKETVVVNIFDNSGKLLMEKEIQSNKGQNLEFIDLSSFKNGMYYLKLTSDKEVLNKKFTKL